MSMTRNDGRGPLDLRPIRIETNVLDHPMGSALIRAGRTHVLCAVSVDERVPPFLEGSGRGWLTAEYAMLPAATHTRFARESGRGGVKGRTHEIQRLIGRSLRSAVDLQAIGPRTLWVDCDVLQADGGTRTAAISGGFVALALALKRLADCASFDRPPLIRTLAALSVGLRHGEVMLDLSYEEDSACDVDMNVVMSGQGELIEIQGTAERAPFSRSQLGALLDAAEGGLQRIGALQRDAIGADTLRLLMG